MHTPFLPAFRSRLAAAGRRATHSLRQATLGQLQDQLRDLLPAPVTGQLKTSQPGSNQNRPL